MNNNAELVAAGKPKIGGAVFVAPVGTPLPTDAKTDLNIAFKGIGYVTDDGLENNNAPDSDTQKAWGGDIVLTFSKDVTDEFTLGLLQSLDPEVLKVVYGDENVTGDLTSGIAVKVNAAEKPAHSWVIDVVMKDAMKRIVIPSAKITDLDKITYKDDEAVNYGITLTAVADSTGNTHYEYLVTTTEIAKEN